MLLFDKLNFSQKIATLLVGIILVVMLPVFYGLLNYLDTGLNSYLQNEYHTKVSSIGRQIKAKVNIAQSKVFGLKHRLNGIESFGSAEFKSISESITDILNHEGAIADVWLMLDPESVKVSEEYRALRFSDDMSGNFKYWYSNEAGVSYSSMSAISYNYFPNIYREVKDLRRPIFGNLIKLDYAAHSDLITIAMPLFRDGQVIGVLGFHYKLSDLRNDFDCLSTPNSESTYSVISNNLTILANSNHLGIGNNYMNSGLVNFGQESGLISRAIESGFKYEGILSTDGYTSLETMLIIEPISFMDQRTSWSFVATFPKELLLNQSTSVRNYIIIVTILSLIIVIVLVLFVFRKRFRPLIEYLKYAEKAAQGLYLQELPTEYLNEKSEIGELYNTLKMLQDNLRKKENLTLQRFDEQNKYNTGIKQLLEIMRGEQKINILSKKVIVFLAEFIDAKSGALYLLNPESGQLELHATYALDRRKAQNNIIEIGEGILGQAAKERQMITVDNIPPDYLSINSALGETPAKCVIAAPFTYEEQVMGVIELATYHSFTTSQNSFVKSCLENIAIVFNSARSNERINQLYNDSQMQALKLQSQQDELIATNEELEAQAKALILSERKLITQQEELQAINEELEEKTGFLEKQKTEIIKKNEALVLAQYQLSQKANEVQMASTYKSEFLANMSHELRTPLNSILILAKNLTDELNEKLNQGQHESLEIIYQCGIDLMNLINDILDLSKIEAGKMNIKIAPVETMHLIQSIRNNFSKTIQDKNIEFRINVSPQIPKEIETDAMRLEQIIKNFISNSIKFTKEGSIEFSIDLINTPERLKSKFQDNRILKLSVKDTGIGIPDDKQRLIFEAFRQIESSLTRKYGGTGLGLSIAKELANVLGGDIQLESTLGKGSTFSLLLPIAYTNPTNKENAAIYNVPLNSGKFDETNPGQSKPAVDISLIDEIVQIKQSDTNRPNDSINDLESLSNTERYKYILDDRERLTPSEKSILIVEDDATFARILTDQVRAKGFKVIFAPSGEEALLVAEKYSPDAVILDIKLPGIDGWEVLRKIKENSKTRHIPVHMMSGEGDTLSAKKQGAVGFINKPTTKEKLDKALLNLEGVIEKKIKDLLVIEDDDYLRKNIIELLKAEDVTAYEANCGAEALAIIRSTRIDCIVLDLTLPDMSGFELLNQLKKESDMQIPPIIVYTGKDLSKDEESTIMQFAESIIIKGVKSEERLIDETALFLHRVVDKFAVQNAETVVNIHDKDFVFKDRTVLLVDDDNRNSYALSKVMIDKELNVLIADNGANAIEMIKQNRNIDLVLMDIMMPVMDGITAIGEIRNTLKLTKLPIIALTAKAMKEDREKCINGGANDYLSKPIEIDKLFSLLRVWLYK